MAPAPVPKLVPVVPILTDGRSNGHARFIGSAPDPFRQFVFTTGLLEGNWADTILSVPGLPELRLHALFVSRSPVLGQLLRDNNSKPPHYLHLAVHDDVLTGPALTTALGTLYGKDLTGLAGCDVPASMALLASGFHLGLEDVAAKGYSLLVDTISVNILPELFRIARTGTGGEGPYPPYTSELLGTLTKFLIENLDASPTAVPEPALVQTLAEMPVSEFKALVEHPQLRVSSIVDRQTFARGVIALRERRAKAAGVEERVLLSFGGSGSGVEIIETPLRGRGLRSANN